MAHPFERDLGYLDRFLEKLKIHAVEAADRVQGERLAHLMDEEVARWAVIRRLLAGGPSDAEDAKGAGKAEVAEGGHEAEQGQEAQEAGRSQEPTVEAQVAAGAEEGAGSGAPPAEEAHTPASGPSPGEVPELLAPQHGSHETPVGPTSWEPRRRTSRRVAGDARTREAHQGRRWTVGPLRR